MNMKKTLSILATSLAFLCNVACSPTPEGLTQNQAMDFLYKYMPLPDKVDYDTAFYQRNVASSFLAREEMPWGKTIPDREFLHFVLPVRVNNENMDESRMVFYAGLKDRVKNLPMVIKIADTFNRVVFTSEGYTIGMGETLMKAIHKL